MPVATSSSDEEGRGVWGEVGQAGTGCVEIVGLKILPLDKLSASQVTLFSSTK